MTVGVAIALCSVTKDCEGGVGAFIFKSVEAHHLYLCENFFSFADEKLLIGKPQTPLYYLAAFSSTVGVRVIVP